MIQRLLFLILSCAFISTNVQAQQKFGNEWVNFDKNYYKIKVAESKLYRIPFNTLQLLDLPLEGTQFQLFYMGKEIPIYVSTNGNFGISDYIEFYGEKLDGTLDQALFLEPSFQLHNYYNLFTDTSAYYLTANSQEENLRYQTIENNLTNLPPKETHFKHTVVNAMLNQFFPGNSITNFANEHNYYAEYGDGEGFASGTVVDKGHITFKSITPSVYLQGENAVVTTRIVGWSDDFSKPTDDHHTQIRFNGELYVDTYFEGRGNITRSFEVPVDVFLDTQEVYYESLQDEGVIADKFSVSYYSITYPRTFEFDNLTHNFTFELPNDGDKYLEVKNFGGGNAPILYDLTNHIRLQPKVINVGGNLIYQIFLPQVAGGAAMRKLHLSHTSFAGVPATVSQAKQVNFINHLALQNQGDYIVLSHPSLMEGEVNQVDRYLQYRNSEAGGAHKAVLVNVEELFEQFSFGVEKHPSSIRNFTNYALEKWEVKPHFLFLLGKSVGYSFSRTNSVAWAQNLVPTFGHIPSDNWLSSPMDNSSYKPQLATGRIPANTPQQVQDYLDKVILYEALQNSPCTKEDRLWSKHAMHLAGGGNLKEEQEYSSFIDSYSDIYEDRLMGGKVVFRYSKASDNVIEPIELDNTINNGVSIINFFGHSSGPDFNIPLGSPFDFKNYGKYPMIIGSSCFTGNIHRNLNLGQDAETSMAETWVLAKDLGAIGYMSSISFGFPSFMDIHVTELYQNMCKENYHQTIGEILQQTIIDAEATTNSIKGTRLVSEQFALTCDPAIILNSWKKPELAITPSDIFVTPVQLTTNLDSFAVNIVLANLGKATTDSVDILIRRTFPDDSQEIAATKKVLMPAYVDTLKLYVQMGEGSFVSGKNSLTVEIDYEGKIEEDCEDNNTVVKDLTIFSDLLVPISPCDFSIVTEIKPTLFASTGQPDSQAKAYIIQVDTTILFNSPVFEQHTLTSEAGVIQWQPNINFLNNAVYYWRVSPIPSDGTDFSWQQSSFIYAPESKKGWNQSHFYQFQQNQYDQIVLDETTRQFEYTGFENELWITNQHNNFNDIGIVLNLNLIIGQSCLSGACNGGIVFAAFKPAATLEPLLSTRTVLQGGCDGRGSFGNIQCSAGFKAGIEFHTGTVEQLDSMLNFMYEDIPDGYYVLSYSVSNHRLGTDDVSEPIFERQEAILKFYEDLGIPQAKNIKPDQTFILFGRKGASNYPGHFVATTEENLNEKIELRLTVGTEEKGQFYSPAIGPSKNWETLQWDYKSLEPFANQDDISINVYGIPPIGSETLLLNTGKNQNTDLSEISAESYPFLRLQALTSDTINFTTPQMEHWRVFFERAPEFALNRQSFFEFYNDTLQEGENLRLRLAVTNASDASADSLLIGYTIINQENNTIPLNQSAQKALMAGETFISDLQYSTEGLVGNNILVVELNPNHDQLEKFGFNNILFVPFFVTSDEKNPVLDVTFDGRHILDGDLVSASPEILIRAKDENPFLELNDPEDFSLQLEHPDGTVEELSLDSELIQFIPATQSQAAEGKNEASIVYTPDLLQDGTYTLTATAKDRSDNRFNPKSYKTSFEVVNEHLISNVLNYPNPFTTSTQFIFTLTGSEVPEQLRIQIMTVSGKIVKEISGAELGELFIGRNRTEYKWDGTDEFGNRLANGVYLYKVTAYRQGQALEKYNTTEKVDGLFKNGWGKMYLMR
ncbi:MAG: C25 family cysteine peptidase [Chitinophagales bacterium]